MWRCGWAVWLGDRHFVPCFFADEKMSVGVGGRWIGSGVASACLTRCFHHVLGSIHMMKRQELGIMPRLRK